VTPRRKPADLKAHCSVASDPGAPLTTEEFRLLVEQMDERQLAQLNGYMDYLVSKEKEQKKAAARPKLTVVPDPPSPDAA
jgi:hypothetical protein